MMKSESDIMRGIDDKFQKLMSQFEMNMGILQKKKQVNEDSQDDVIAIKENEILDSKGITRLQDKQKHNKSNEPRKIDIKEKSSGNSTDLKEVMNERSEPVKIIEPQPKKLDKPDGDNINDITALKNKSNCADTQNKKKKKKNKTIYFSGQNNSANCQGSEDNKSFSIATGSKSGSKKKSRIQTCSESVGSSKKRSLNSIGGLIKKPSKTITNVSKKVKRRSMRLISTGKDWISFNRNNAGKMKRTEANKPKNDKPQLKEKNKFYPDKSNKEKLTYNMPEMEAPYEAMENRFISEFIQNEMLNKIRNTDNKNITIKNNEREKISFRTVPQKNIVTVNDKNELQKQTNYTTQKNITDTKVKPDIYKKNSIFYKDKFFPRGKLGVTKSLLDHRDNKINNESSDTTDHEMNKENTLINGRQFSIEGFNTNRMDLKSIYELNKARSEMKVSNNVGAKEDFDENQLEMDDYFRQIPFVVGRSISRTFNLGLSFQYAMSMLKRIHNKKDVKEVLSIGCPENIATTENIHCFGSGTCEAMLSSNWTKEDEEEWEENPWDPELNRRRPKCTCLPNNCTTLKNVLKQLSLRKPNPNTRSFSSITCTAQRLESEIDMLTRPNLKQAKSQTRTELLRNIRTIQMQLSPPSEILK